jgi:very-short-patch-repair endonuclease
MVLRLNKVQAQKLGVATSDIKPGRRNKGTKSAALISHSLAGTKDVSVPQAKLFSLLHIAPETKRFPWQWELDRVVPGRRYTVDMGVVFSPGFKLAVEVDGFSVHGRNLEGYYRDREKDWLLGQNDWVCLRIPAGLVVKDPNTVLSRIGQTVARIEARYQRQLLNNANGVWESNRRQVVSRNVYPDFSLVACFTQPRISGWFGSPGQ